jgi:hypothetical protein
MSIQPVQQVPALERQISDASAWTEQDGEKGNVRHLDEKAIPQTITEEDEHGNVGLAAYQQSKQMGEITPEQNKRIRRRIDMFLLPLFLITQTLQYLDKTALN